MESGFASRVPGISPSGLEAVEHVQGGRLRNRLTPKASGRVRVLLYGSSQK